MHSTIEMKNSVIMAIWHHIRSTEENPDHFCVQWEQLIMWFPAWRGKWYKHIQSWASSCWWLLRRDLCHLWIPLSDESVLSACLHMGARKIKTSTQCLDMAACPHEWQHETHSSLPKVGIATYLAIGIVNYGARTIMDVLQQLGVEPELHCQGACKKIDRKRIYYAKVMSVGKAKAGERP